MLEQQGADFVALAAQRPIGRRIEEIRRPGGIGQVGAHPVKLARRQSKRVDTKKAEGKHRGAERYAERKAKRQARSAKRLKQIE